MPVDTASQKKQILKIPNLSLDSALEFDKVLSQKLKEYNDFEWSYDFEIVIHYHCNEDDPKDEEKRVNAMAFMYEYCNKLKKDIS